MSDEIMMEKKKRKRKKKRIKDPPLISLDNFVFGKVQMLIIIRLRLKRISVYSDAAPYLAISLFFIRMKLIIIYNPFLNFFLAMLCHGSYSVIIA